MIIIWYYKHYSMWKFNNWIDDPKKQRFPHFYIFEADDFMRLKEA